MFILEGSVLHNPCPLAALVQRPPRPPCSSFLAHALEFSSLGNQTHIYSVTKWNKCINNYFLNGTASYIFILFFEEVLGNIFFYCTYIYSKPYFLGFYHYVKK